MPFDEYDGDNDEVYNIDDKTSKYVKCINDLNKLSNDVDKLVDELSKFINKIQNINLQMEIIIKDLLH